MCGKTFVCKMTAMVLSAALAVGWMPVGSQPEVNAAELGQVQEGFQFGNNHAGIFCI